MSSTNTSRRPDGCISIPIEIVSTSNRSSKSRQYSSNRLSQLYNQQPTYSPLNEDFLLSKINSKRSYNQSDNNRFRSNSDFIQSNLSHRLLNDFPDSRSINVNQISNEYRVPSNQLNRSHDRSDSPASQNGESSTRPPPPPPSSSTATQQQESDFKIPKDATNSSLQSNDQQVPSADTTIRDPNLVALGKLEQIKQKLEALNQQVELFTGSTRDDRLYKLLDEQALKIMLSCDELINVSSDIKEKRKEMIQNVQTVLAKLESKVPIQSNSNSTGTALAIYDPSSNNSEQEQQESLIDLSA